MENAVDAIKMAFGMMVFVIAITASMYLFTIATSTSKVLLYAADKTNYYDNIKLDNNEEITTRTVGIETIIPTLYRYAKENFAVKIYNKSGDLVQIFDLNIEGRVKDAVGKKVKTDEQKALVSLYGIPSVSGEKTNPYLFGVPWNGAGNGGNRNKDIKTRIDLYVKGECGYINGTKVDYTDNNLKNFKDSKFTEQFTEYAYKGDTISVGEGDGIETITGNVKVENKIVITYQEQ